ncbi:hypothetical protein DNTS_006098, partial [Danionella cerebrum]
MKEQRTCVWSMAVVVIALVVCTVPGNDANRVFTCCTEVSRNVTCNITGFEIQNERLPCVHAIILKTRNKSFCADPDAPWVKMFLRNAAKVFENKEIYNICRKRNK